MMKTKTIAKGKCFGLLARQRDSLVKMEWLSKSLFYGRYIILTEELEYKLTFTFILTDISYVLLTVLWDITITERKEKWNQLTSTIIQKMQSQITSNFLMSNRDKALLIFV